MNRKNKISLLGKKLSSLDWEPLILSSKGIFVDINAPVFNIENLRKLVAEPEDIEYPYPKSYYPEKIFEFPPNGNFDEVEINFTTVDECRLDDKSGYEIFVGFGKKGILEIIENNIGTNKYNSKCERNA
jgi:hypothetical protein